MENLLLYNQYYQKVRLKFEQDLLFSTVHIIYDYNLLNGSTLSNKKLHCLIFLVNAKRYEKNLGFYKNDEIPEFEKWTLGYDTWDKGPVQTYIQKIMKKFDQKDIIGQNEIRALQLMLKPQFKVKNIRSIITEVVEKYGIKSENELANLIADFLRIENSLDYMRSFRKSKMKFEV